MKVAEPLRIVKYAELSQKERELLLKRSEVDAGSVLLTVVKIVSDVRRDGDKALLKYTERFDGVKLDEIRVSEGEIRVALASLSQDVIKALKRVAKAIEKFHKRQMRKEWFIQMAPGVKAGQLVRPIESVGIYVPGGRASYPSTLLMAAIPAKVAGVKRIIVCTPPRKDGKVPPAVLAAAEVAGIKEIYRVGGAQAIAAMAYGTETVPKVEKIVGPGNVYVAAAKQVVAPDVRIDSIAGPSEVMVLADDSANPKFIAADLVAQAEHDPEAAAILVTPSERLAAKVREEARKMVRATPRWKIVIESFTKYSRIIVVRDLEEGIRFANEYAPEHLEIMVENPREVLAKINNAGAVFLGDYSPVAAGDFAVGANHILPTGGEAKRLSGLSVQDFLKFPTVQELSKDGLRRLSKVIKLMAETEDLPAHAKSVEVRLGER
ncbi:MAG: histidinol dehydrogenase [Candidatus Hadarchaeales archaeon]